MITLIAAASTNNALGKNGNLLWHLPADFQHFKKLTTGHCIIMGRKTFESFPKPLPNRRHIIITRQKDYFIENCLVVHSLEEALQKASELDKNPYVIGGGEIYHQALAFADVIELTRVEAVFEDADAFFPEIAENQWELISSKFFPKDEKHLYNFTFETYLRK